MMRAPATIVSACLAALVTISCSALRSGDDDVSLDLTFSRRAIIGGTADTVIVLRSLLASGVGVDAADHIYVLDAIENRVGIFTRGGEFVAWRGRAGGGPGEIQNSFFAQLSVSSSGELWVYDRGKRSLVGFDTSGAPLSELPIRPGGLLWGFGVDQRRDVLLLTNKGDSVVLRRQLRSRAETLAVRVLPSPRPLAAERCGLSGHADRPIFAGGLPWTLRDAAFAYVPTDSAVVVTTTPAGATRRLKRSRPLAMASAALAAQTMPSGWTIEIPGQSISLI
jgi:hypothetical protein